MRVIAGKWKGRRLVGFDASHLRPTSDRVKESIFNILSFHLEGAKVLDLYGGTGNLSIESLSRGAANLTTVEMNPKSIQIIQKNLKALGIEDGIDVRKQDVFVFLKKYSGDAFDIILIDPPFTEKIADPSVAAVSTSQAFHKNTIIVCEYSKFEKMDKAYGDLVNYDTRDFGDKKVAFFRHKDGT